MSVETKRLIDDLVKGLLPASPLPGALARFFRWFAGALFCLGAGVALFGMRDDVLTALVQPHFALQFVATLLLGISSASSAFILSVPDRNRPLLLMIPIVTAVLWLAAIGYAFATSTAIVGGYGLTCLRDISVLALPPGVLLFAMVRRAAPLQTGWVGAFTTLAAGALGAIGTQFICRNDDPLHLLLWHYVPVLIIGWLGVVIGRRLLNWQADRGAKLVQ